MLADEIKRSERIKPHLRCRTQSVFAGRYFELPRASLLPALLPALLLEEPETCDGAWFPHISHCKALT